MQSRFYKILAALVASTVMTFGSAQAIPFSVDMVDGVWSSVAPGGAASGVGTNQIMWGTPVYRSQQSGYLFEGAAPPAIVGNVGDQFDIGTFTHINYPITGSSITNATLDVTFDLTIDGVFFNDVMFSFMFEHEETPNSGANPDDIVTFVNPAQDQAVIANGQSYLVQLLGFEVGGNLVDEFFTKEKYTNTAELVAVITPTSVVPEPMTYLTLGTFLAMACLVQRRKRATKIA